MTSRSDLARELEGDEPAKAPPPSRDLQIQVLFWDTFDNVLAGLKVRKLTDLFNGEQIAALTATLFIQRAKG